MDKECKVKFVDDLKTDYKIIPMQLKVSRAKEKEETRKMTQKYFEEEEEK